MTPTTQRVFHHQRLSPVVEAFELSERWLVELLVADRDRPALAALVLEKPEDKSSDDAQHKNVAEYEAHETSSEIDKATEEVNKEVEDSSSNAEEELCRLLNEFAGSGEEGPDDF